MKIRPYSDLPDDIITKIQQDFSTEEWFTVLQLVTEFHVRNPEFSERIMRCIVFLAHGNLEKLANAVEMTQEGWRDLIIAAEHERIGGKDIQMRDFNLPFGAENLGGSQ